MVHYLEELNPSQKEAVLHKEGPMLIIAGAGSGKTRVLTHRIAHLMKEGVDAFNILNLTFTNKAAREMKARIATVVGQSEAKNLWMGTFHSVFARILRSEAEKLGYPSNFTIYDTQDSVRLLGAIIREMNLDKERYKAKQVLGRISQYKNSLITVRAYRNNPDLLEADTMASRPKMGDVYQAYVERCFKSGAMDFDDLLLRTNELLSRFPEVLAKYQDRFRYVMVDEYQDTNHSQYLIVRALADRFQNICVVGDDSQSIYAFRGANINNILNFKKHYPNAKTFKLEQNYRSSKNIVQAASSLIEKNKTKLDKEIWTANNEGPKVKVMRTLSDGEEGRWVANSIFENKMNHQLTNNSFCILYRTNAQSRAMEDALRKKRIAYKVYGGTSFYQRKEIKDVLAYLRILINPNDEEAFKRIVNYPARGIGQTTLDKLMVAANHAKKPLFELVKNIDKIDLKIHAGTQNKLRDFATMIERFSIDAQKQNAFEVAEGIVKQVRIVKELEADGTPEGISKVENIQELLNGIKYFIDDSREKGQDASLAVFLEDVALKTDLDSDKPDDAPVVSLMTIHLAKGLEFPYVYVVGMEESLFPSAMSMNTRSELEEERRLFYVALTRAEHQAYLSYSQTRYRWGKLIDCEPSRFLEEIDPRFIELMHPQSRSPSNNKFVDSRLFQDEFPSGKIRYRKPIPRKKSNLRFNRTSDREISKTKATPPLNFKPVLPSSTEGQPPSDFLISEGNRVEHARFGRGTVVKLEGLGGDAKAEIQFDNQGLKKLILKFAKLTVVERS